MDWIYRHPRLLESILARSSGAIGELMVAEELANMGYRAGPASINARQCDIRVISPRGTEFSIEVKTVKVRGAPYLVRQCPEPSVSSFWVFVHAPRAHDEFPDPRQMAFRVVKTQETARIWQNKFEGKEPKAADITWRDLQALKGQPDPWFDRWDQLPQ